MQRLLSRHLLRSSAVSLLSFPSLLVKSGLVEPDKGRLDGLDEPELEGVPVTDFSCLDLDVELPPELEGLEDEEGWLLLERETLSLRSQ